MNFDAPHFIPNAFESHHITFLTHGFAFYCSVTDNLSNTSEMSTPPAQAGTTNIAKYLQIGLELKQFYLLKENQEIHDNRENMIRVELNVKRQ